MLQSDTHAGALDISEHDKFDVRGRFVVMKLILTGVVGDKTKLSCISMVGPLPRQDIKAYLSSSPPNFRTMFRNEKTVPNMSFASSSVVRSDCPKTGGTPLLEGISEVGREGFPDIEVGRGSQRLL